MALSDQLNLLESSGLIRLATSEPEPEFLFKHVLIGDAAYASLLKTDRRELHKAVGETLEQLYPEQRDLLAGLLVHHFAQAGDSVKETHYAAVAGKQALRTGAFREARHYFERVLARLPENPPSDGDGRPTRVSILYQLSQACEGLGELREARSYLSSGLTVARALGDQQSLANILSSLCWVLSQQGEYEEARRLGYEALAYAQSIVNPSAMALAQRRLGIVASYQGDQAQAAQHFENALAGYRGIRDQEGVAGCLNNLGIIANQRGDVATAIRYYQEALALSREIDDRRNVGKCLANLGNLARKEKDYAAAARYLQEALTILREVGAQETMVNVMLTFADVALEQGDHAVAKRRYDEGFASALQISALPLALAALAGMAGLLAEKGQHSLALELLGLVLNHPGCNDETRRRAEMILSELRKTLPADAVAAGLERGRGKELSANLENSFGERTLGANL